jgi:hypothetical protein
VVSLVSYFATAKPSGFAAGKPPQNFNNSRDAATQEERYTIERMREEGYKQARIAECLNLFGTILGGEGRFE